MSSGTTLALFPDCPDLQCVLCFALLLPIIGVSSLTLVWLHCTLICMCMFAWLDRLNWMSTFMIGPTKLNEHFYDIWWRLDAFGHVHFSSAWEREWSVKYWCEGDQDLAQLKSKACMVTLLYHDKQCRLLRSQWQTLCTVIKITPVRAIHARG